MKKVLLVILSIVVLAACGKKEEPTKVSIIDSNRFEFQVIQSPLTNKCYEAVINNYTYTLNRVFEIPCDLKK